MSVKITKAYYENSLVNEIHRTVRCNFIITMFHRIHHILFLLLFMILTTNCFVIHLLAPSDYFLFPVLKDHPKGSKFIRFSNTTVSEDQLTVAIQKLSERWQKCMTMI